MSIFLRMPLNRSIALISLLLAIVVSSKAFICSLKTKWKFSETERLFSFSMIETCCGTGHTSNSAKQVLQIATKRNVWRNKRRIMITWQKDSISIQSDVQKITVKKLNQILILMSTFSNIQVTTLHLKRRITVWFNVNQSSHHPM